MNSEATQTKAGGTTLTRDVSVLNRYGIHARPAALLVKSASRFACEILIEKNGVKKLIYQAPWYEEGVYRGIVELSLPIPFDLPHFVRS